MKLQRQIIPALVLALSAASFIEIRAAADPVASLGRGLTTRSKTAQYDAQGEIEKVQYVEDTHMDVRRNVITTHTRDEHGVMRLSHRETTLTDKYWGSFKMTEGLIEKTFDLVVKRIETTVKDVNGGYTQTVHALNEQQNLVLHSRITVTSLGDGRFETVVEKVDKDGVLIETSRTQSRKAADIDFDDHELRDLTDPSMRD